VLYAFGAATTKVYDDDNDGSDRTQNTHIHTRRTRPISAFQFVVMMDGCQVET
jgi:hypothetical protein